MRIVPVEDKDLSLVKKLLEEAGLSWAGIEGQFQHFLKLMLDGEIAAVAGLEVYDQVGLVRSVAVAQEYRHSGLGRGLIKALVNKTRFMGLKELYLVTDTAADYFYRFGFRPIDRDKVYAPVLQSEHFRSVCSRSAISMCLKL
ncbi:MAG TPA: arsenic resistance N-acetyltransferase ArsN2 [bacterium]|jgi:amino-acid N-acetyltransferase|nr:arsenic resistance N-acetyltransferase ArsN2 [bacterium]